MILTKFNISFLILLGLFVVSKGYIVEPGPVVKATRGGVWPLPQSIVTSEDFYLIRPSLFRFRATGVQCDILDEALQRYWEIISQSLQKDSHQENGKKLWKAELGSLDVLDVNVAEPCSGTIYPFMDMIESYTLDISTATLTAPTVWGALHGLETFAQLIHLAEDEITLIINSTIVEDFPRFNHRGLLIDTSRHYLPMSIIYQMLDAMSYNKLNVFHWHIVDDHSFPFQSLTFPELSIKGAYHPLSKIYTPTDVADVIEYARMRGIRVIPEFDTPGHTRSWGLAHPELLTACGTPYEGKYGPMDPSNDYVYTFLQELFTEVEQRFPDQYVHLGGDEVGFECWESNSNITAFMASMGIAGDYVALESYFLQKVIHITDDLSFHSIVWEEIYTNHVEITNTTIVHVWKVDGFQDLMYNVTADGFYTLLSACWYLDHLANGGDWKKYYECEPLGFNGTVAQEKLVLGGEACMWAEAVNEHNVGSRVWPRASAAAEKLWSAKDAESVEEAAKRLEEHACRLNSRGIPAQPPNGPGVCL